MEPLSSAAIVITSLVVTKAFEKAGEKLGDTLTEKLGRFIQIAKSRSLSKTQSIQSTWNVEQHSQAVSELESQSKDDLELSRAMQELVAVVESNPRLLKKVYDTANAIENESSLIQNHTKLAEKIGLVVQNGTVNIDSMRF